MLIYAVMNFECADKGVETVIKQCIITTISNALSVEETNARRK